MRDKHGALEVEFQHDAQRARQARIQADREVQREHLAALQELVERRQRLCRASGRPLARSVYADLRRTERAPDGRVVVEQREEHDDALDDRGSEARFEANPVAVVPALHRGQLLLSIRPVRRPVCRRATVCAICSVVQERHQVVMLRMFELAVRRLCPGRPGAAGERSDGSRARRP